MRVDQVVSGFIYHQLQDNGTVAKNSKKLHGISMSDSAPPPRHSPAVRQPLSATAAITPTHSHRESFRLSRLHEARGIIRQSA
jgi:hypothetical protein